MVRIALALASLAAGGASAQEVTIANCIFPRGSGADVEIRISQDRDIGYWTEDDRRVELQIIRNGSGDQILGMTANRLNGSIAMLSLFRPSSPPYERRRDAVLTVHSATSWGGIGEQSLQGVCDVEDIS